MTNTTRDALQKSLDRLDRTIKKKKPDKISILTEWFHSWSNYLNSESTFDPFYMTKYNPGDVITVDLGFNIGSELGGEHPAIVIEDNAKSADTVMIVPVSSLKPGQTKENVHDTNVYLGILPPQNKTKKIESFAVLNQMRAISKIRICRPKKKYDKKHSIDDILLHEIYTKITNRYANKVKENKELASQKEYLRIVESEVAPTE